MPVRRWVSSVVFGSVERRVRTWVDDLRRDHDRDVADLREQLKAAALPPTAGGELEEEVAQLKKKLSMAMGAIQAASAQIVQLRQEVDQAANVARQAMQKATTAQTTAESATEGVTALESSIEDPGSEEPSTGEIPRPRKANRRRGDHH
jgi:chromosome segregation ATPase